MVDKIVDSKTTYVKITFGFGYNKFKYPNVYRRGKGTNLYGGIVNLFRQRGNNSLPAEQKQEVINQMKQTVNLLELDQERERKTKD